MLKKALVVLSFLIVMPVFAGDNLFYREVNLIGGYSRQDKWVGKSGMLANSLGFEDYRKFSGDYGDFLTTDLQVRAAYDSLENSRNAWGMQVHNAWLQFNLGGGKKLTLGHFDPVFGLEPVLDTHATILRTLIERDIGFNKDWGVGFKGFNHLFDYEAGLQLGSGMSIYRRDNNFLFTARVSKPAGSNQQFGLSGMYGRCLETMGENTIPRNDMISAGAVLKKRIGLDGQYLYGPRLFKGEAAYGSDNHAAVAGYMVEADYTLPRNQNVELEFQLQSWFHDTARRGSDDTALTLGSSYKLNQDITLRLAYQRELNMREGNEDNTVIFQFYFFGR